MKAIHSSYRSPPPFSNTILSFCPTPIYKWLIQRNEWMEHVISISTEDEVWDYHKVQQQVLTVFDSVRIIASLPMCVAGIQGSLRLHRNQFTGTVAYFLPCRRILEPKYVWNKARVPKQQELGYWPLKNENTRMMGPGAGSLESFPSTQSF